MKKLEYLTHGTMLDEKDTPRLEQEGFEVKEGRATVSGDLLYALEWAINKKRHEKKSGVVQKNESRIIILQLPGDKEIFYDVCDGGVKNNREKKEITGKTARFPSRRNHLAIYEKGELVDLENRRKFTIPRENILMNIVPDKRLIGSLQEIKKKMSMMQSLEPDAIAEEVAIIIQKNKDNQIRTNDDTKKVIRELVVSTIKALAVNRIRNWYLDIKKYQGYSIKDIRRGERRWPPPMDVEKLKKTIFDLKEEMHNQVFSTGITEVDRYLKLKTEALIKEFSSIEILPRKA